MNNKLYTLFKIGALGFFLLMYSLQSLAQTNSSSDGLWNVGANWSAGVPISTEVVNITHAMELDVNITIDNGGDYTVSAPGSIIDPAGGSSYNVSLRGSGTFDIGGNVTVEGNFTAINNGSLIVRSGDTLRVGGDLLFKNSTGLIVEAGGVVIVDGDLSLQNSNSTVINGQVSVGGNVSTKNTATISGTGNLEAGGTITTANSSSVFGNTGNCNPGPCEEGSGQGLPVKLVHFEANFISKNQVQVEWETETEINNEFYTILGSYDGKQYEELQLAKGGGSSNTKLQYRTIIDGVQSKTIYLKLKQTDFDGKFEEFNPIAVNYYPSQFNSNDDLSIYPNPTEGHSLFIKLENRFEDTFILRWLNFQGQLVYQESKILSSIETEILIGRNIPKGVYILQIQNHEDSFQEKVIIR